MALFPYYFMVYIPNCMASVPDFGNKKSLTAKTHYFGNKASLLYCNWKMIFLYPYSVARLSSGIDLTTKDSVTLRPLIT